ncbi:hypothetical protein [Ktedonobacter robiniae]|nr:hypothetical protein [Ktedonobacter robiniae]
MQRPIAYPESRADFPTRDICHGQIWRNFTSPPAQMQVHSCVEVHQDEHTEISISEQIRRRLIVIMTARILQIIVGLAGLCALVLGLVIWIANTDLTDIHMFFGLLVTLGLLVMSIIALTARGQRIWGMVGIVYAIILLIFGELQFNLLVGNLHWLIQALHLLAGIGAIVLTSAIGARYRTLKRGEAKPEAASQVSRL